MSVAAVPVSTMVPDLVETEELEEGEGTVAVAVGGPGLWLPIRSMQRCSLRETSSPVGLTTAEFTAHAIGSYKLQSIQHTWCETKFYISYRCM